jgi:hypothetical protein
MTGLEPAMAAGRARELGAVDDHVEIDSPAPTRDPGGMIEPREHYRRIVVRHRQAAGTCALARVVLHLDRLRLCPGPRHDRDWSRVETVPSGHPGAVERLLEGIASVQP